MSKVIIILVLIATIQTVTAQDEKKSEKTREAQKKPLNYSESKSYRPIRKYPIDKIVSSYSNSKKRKSSAKKKTNHYSQNLTNFIMVPISVFKSNGEYVSDIRKDEVKIFENGIEQEVSFLGIPNTPLNIFLLMDKSPSFIRFEKKLYNSLDELFRVIKANDRVSGFVFNNALEFVATYTDNKKKLIGALEKKKTGSGTSLYDVSELLLKDHVQDKQNLNIIIFVTDGVDTTSRYSDYKQSIKMAENSNAIFFSILIDTSKQYKTNYLGNIARARRGSIVLDQILKDSLSQGKNRTVTNRTGQSKEEYEIGQQFMSELAASTGGRVVFVKPKLDQLKQAFEIIGTTIRLQNFIGYKPQSPNKSNDRKELKVRINRPDLIIRIRDNYY